MLCQANILIDDQLQVRICDIGQWDYAELQSTEPSHGSGCSGTPRYQAPELINPKVPSPRKTIQSDIYALGMTMHHILTRMMPFHELKREEAVIMAVILGDRPLRLTSGDAAIWINDEAWTLITSCWHQDPYKRPTSSHVEHSVCL